MSKRDNDMWWIKKMRNEKPSKSPAKVEIVPVEKDEYILSLEEQIDELKKKVKEYESKEKQPTYNPYEDIYNIRRVQGIARPSPLRGSRMVDPFDPSN